MLRSLRSFITLFLLLTTISGSAQSVGVVMSGGGAKGLYHIGVLEALEERGIPIDYVAGTSMGSIVAGLYAAGYSPAQMREIVASGEIERWLSGKIDSSYGAYYRQYRQIPSLLSIRLDTKRFFPTGEERTRSVEDVLRDDTSNSNFEDLTMSAPRASIYMPKSIISSFQIDLALSRLFSPASESASRNFDNLMIPYLCVASDLTTRQAVVLDRGDLGQAIRASMAIPIAFEAVTMGDAVLYDGGIYDNFPWRPLLEKHNPDILIGSICTGGNTVINANSSLIDQVFALTTSESDYDLPEGSITIRRDVPVGMLEFEAGERVIDMGYEDTMAQIDSIEQSITARRDSTYYDSKRKAFLDGVKPLIFEKYEVNGLTSEQSLYVNEYLHTTEQKGNILQREMPFEELEENLFSILSSGDFSTAYPEVRYNRQSEQYEFAIDLETKPQMKLSLGGHLSSTLFNQLFMSLNYQSVKRVAQSYYADIYLGTVATSAIIGGRTDFYLKRPLYLDYYYVYSSKSLGTTSVGNVTSITNCEDVSTNNNYISGAVGLPLSRRSMVSLRANAGWANYYYDPAEVLSGDDITANTLYDRTRLGFVGVKAEYQRSTLDRKVYPQSGSHLSVSTIGMYGSERNYQTMYSRATATPAESHAWYGARLKYQKYFTPPSESWFSFGLDIDAVYTNLNQIGNPTANLLMMPSYQPVTQSQMVFMPNFSSDAFVGVGAIPVFEIFDNTLLRTGFYGMYRRNYDVSGITPGLIDQSRMHYITEATLVYNSTVGPVSLSLTKYDVNDWNNMYLTIGFGFPLFAPKGIFY